MRLEYRQAERALACHFACFVQCECARQPGSKGLLELFDLLSGLLPEERQLLLESACKTCSTGITVVKPPAPIGPTNPVSPTLTLSTCKDLFRATICQQKYIDRATTLRSLIVPLNTVLDAIDVNQGALLENLDDALDAFISFCNSGTDDNFQKALVGYCLLRSITSSASYTAMWITLGPVGAGLKAGLDKLFSDEDRAKLDACCRYVVGTQVAQEEVQGGGGGGGSVNNMAPQNPQPAPSSPSPSPGPQTGSPGSGGPVNFPGGGGFPTVPTFGTLQPGSLATNLASAIGGVLSQVQAQPTVAEFASTTTDRPASVNLRRAMIASAFNVRRRP